MYKYIFKTTKSWSKYQKAVENKLLKLLTRVGGVNGDKDSVVAHQGLVRQGGGAGHE